MMVEMLCQEKGTGEFINHVEETAGKEEVANIFRYTYETVEDNRKVTITFSWLTDIELTEKILEEMICAARGRILHHEIHNDISRITDSL